MIPHCCPRCWGSRCSAASSSISCPAYCRYCRSSCYRSPRMPDDRAARSGCAFLASAARHRRVVPRARGRADCAENGGACRRLGHAVPAARFPHRHDRFVRDPREQSRWPLRDPAAIVPGAYPVGWQRSLGHSLAISPPARSRRCSRRPARRRSSARRSASRWPATASTSWRSSSPSASDSPCPISPSPHCRRWPVYLPRPGAWMMTLRRVLAFLLAATALWLVSVLAAQTSLAAALAVIGALLVAALVPRFVTAATPRRAGIAAACVVAIAAPILLAGSSGVDPGGRHVVAALRCRDDRRPGT